MHCSLCCVYLYIVMYVLHRTVCSLTPISKEWVFTRDVFQWQETANFYGFSFCFFSRFTRPASRQVESMSRSASLCVFLSASVYFCLSPLLLVGLSSHPNFLYRWAKRMRMMKQTTKMTTTTSTSTWWKIKTIVYIHITI